MSILISKTEDVNVFILQQSRCTKIIVSDTTTEPRRAEIDFASSSLLNVGMYKVT